MADGLIGISERYCIFSSYSTETDQRNIHLHLYNRYPSERYSTYNRYYTSSSEKYALASRELIYDERTTLFPSYSTEVNERDIAYGRGYEVESDERNVTYERWYTTQDERYTHYALTEISERTIWLLPKWNDYRYAFTKSWYVTERHISTLGKLYDRYADQRNIWYQLYPSPTSVRNVYFESCNYYFTFTINPQYSELISNVDVTPPYRELFEDEPVTEYTITFNYLKIKDTLKDTDLGLVIWNPIKQKYVSIPIANYGILRIPLFKYGDTHTYFVDGFFVPVNDMLYISLNPLCSEYKFTYGGNTECMELIKEGEKHGYIKSVLFGRQYQWNVKETFVNIKYQPITFKFFISDNFIYHFGNIFNIRLMYGYPDKGLIHSVILQLTKQ